MNSPRFLLLSLLTALRCLGTAPEKIDGSIYYESYSIIAPGNARSSVSFAITLKSDSTYTGLFTNGRFSVNPPTLGVPADGTYVYKKTDSLTAELTLSGFPQNGSGSTTRTLKFASDTSGTIPILPNDFFTNGHVFRLAPAGTAPPLVNCANRSFVRAGGTAFTGFVIAPGDSRVVLVRAVGPGLTPFGITDALGNPRIAVVNAAINTAFVTNDDWASEDNAPSSSAGRADAIKRTSAAVGAFPLPDNSKDAAVILNLPPGAYIAQVTSSDPADSGQALIEVYMLP